MADKLTTLQDSNGNLHHKPIIRSEPWELTLTLTNNDGGVDWDATAESDTWEVWIDEQELGGDPDVIITASSASIDGSDASLLELAIEATSSETDQIGGSGPIEAEAAIRQYDGSDYRTRWEGKVDVIDPVGAAT